MHIVLTVNGKEFAATLSDTAAARAFFARLPMTLAMSELNGNEKYCYLDAPLPEDAAPVGTIEAGDLMLFGDRCVILFYETFATPYRYTRLGALDEIGALGVVGDGDVTVRFEAR